MRFALLTLIAMPCAGNSAEPKDADETWWSLRPLARPSIPSMANPDISNPIDVFIAAKLKEKKLSPSPLADRRTLIRRLTYDLHGLPPMPEEIDAFVADESPNAYERLVERLLASPHYGERWGRHWLDVVPFADTHGYDKDKRRDQAWPYRDYVIQSFNEDKPYGRFIREQLAGDVLFPKDFAAWIGTGFIAAGPWDFVGHAELREGTMEKDKTRLIDRDDMVANTFSTFQSLTVHCARCHNHKFDPIPQKDYYRLQAIFAGVERGNRLIPHVQDPVALALRQRRDQLQMRRAAVDEIVAKTVSPILEKVEQVAAPLRAALEKIPAPSKSEPSSSNGWHSAIHPKPDVTCWVQVDLGESQPLDLIRLYPARPVDFADTPGFGFPSRFKVEISDDAEFKQAIVVDNHLDKDFPHPKDEAVSLAVGGNKARYVRMTATRMWKRTDDFIFALAEMEIESLGKNLARGATVTSSESIEAGRWGRRYLVDGATSRFRLPDRTDPQLGPKLRERETLISQIAQLEEIKRLELARVVDANLAAERDRLILEMVDLEKKLTGAPNGQMVYAAVPQPQPREIYVLKRGDVTQKKELATPGGLSCLAEGLSPEFELKDVNKEGERRAALAEWIANRDNPLTWRSIANRVWHYHFGKGIVDTPNDFGKNGSLPTHPELLDFLACEVRDGQSLKHLHRLIVNSRTYRQVSTNDEANAKIDGENRFLWRANRQRLDAESLRDSVLTLSGKMEWKMGGPGYDLFFFKDDHSPIYDHTDASKGNRPEAWRRTVYRFAVRSVPNPFLDCLDGADPNANTPRRNQTLTALQALAMLNDAFILQQADYFAERLRGQSQDPQTQVEFMLRSCLGRTPTPEEEKLLTHYARQHGLARACRLVWNLNEFVFVD